MRPTHRITIAIDGYSACGKSTLARRLAAELGYLYVDTGAMYRAVTLYFLQRDLDWRQPEVLEEALQHIYLQFIRQPDSTLMEIHLNGSPVEAAIRTMQVSEKVSELSALPAVRRFLVEQQRDMARDGGVVLDGRDIGTVVFPLAELKIFVTASLEVRVERRMRELQASDAQVNRESVRGNLLLRDHEDTTREDSPLRRAPDAVLIDTSENSPDDTLRQALELLSSRFNLA
jgi:cytidylate kinase